jgi:peptide/nickel transport system permease protein
MNLLKYIFKRLLNGLTVMFGVVLVIFVLFNILPVNSARMTLGQRADTASIEAIEREFQIEFTLV